MSLILNPYSFNSAAFALAYKGHGRVQRSGSGASTLNYSTVAGGSAPSAGDLVVWACMRQYVGGGGLPDPFDDLTGSGWAQVRKTVNSDQQTGTLLGKVVVSGDISAPPTILNETISSQGLFMWTAYAVTGTITTVAVSASTALNNGGNSAPSSIALDSSGLAGYAITAAVKGGDDGAQQIGGITFDNEQTYDAGGSTSDYLAGMKLDLGGASYTITGGDDGFFNVLFAGFVTAV